MSLDDFIARKGAEHEAVLRTASQFILNAHPAMHVSIKWSLPVFQLKKNLIYMDVQKNIPLLGFMDSLQLEGMQSLLDYTGRKQIGHFYLLPLDQVCMENMALLVDTAIQLDLHR